MTDLERAPLEAELRELETCLETPFVPGELERWMDEVRSAWERLSPGFVDRFEREQPRICEQIAEDEPELLERVEELRVHNGQVLAWHRDLDRRLAWLGERAARVEPDEKRLDDELEGLVQDGLQFVIEARTQEVSLRTWLLEAYQRETGPVD
ncbi:MAG TPA: hypothetical protein VML55_12115 [Planctomycetaceae bacterium]|nr:hypothetical protein [Planctomycetaceae bacterium]